MQLQSESIASADWTKENSFKYCKKIALGHYENFPVGSLLVPRSRRKHFYTIYAFARAADDFADEGNLSVEQRLQELEQWRQQLDRCLVGDVFHPVFIALSETIKQCDLPPVLFHNLIDAFVLDVKRSRHETFEDLLNYSRFSANPVGRLILLLFGHREPQFHKWSDAICTALQLTNFWQDILVDLAKDRIYVPQEEMKKYGYSEQDLREHLYNENYVEMMHQLSARTKKLFEEGKPLCTAVKGRLSLELKLVWLGGTSILNALEKESFNIFRFRPTIRTSQKMKILLKTLLPGRFN